MDKQTSSSVQWNYSLIETKWDIKPGENILLSERSQTEMGINSMIPNACLYGKRKTIEVVKRISGL